MRIAYLTAGAAGMYCGSCMHDNSLARALIARGADCLLLPMYTPIRTDEADVSAGRLFFGGINVFLQQKVPRLGRLPGPLLRLLDAPWLLRLATQGAGATRPEVLGELTVSMLRGTAGHQAAEVQRLVRWLSKEFRPDVILLSNLLIGGCIPAIREAMDVRIVAWLQGDDIFIDHLPSPHKEQALELLSNVARQTDACLTNSRFYATKMQQMLSIPSETLHVVPLAIDVAPFTAMDLAEPRSPAGDPPVRISYLARLAPEKGFHNLVEAFLELSRRPIGRHAELHYAGWLGKEHRPYLDQVQRQLAQAGLGDRQHYHGSPTLDGKLAFLRHSDVLSVPTVYEEPKGLFVLESLAAGVPVIQPNHGAFPELLETTGGGLLVPPADAVALADALESLLVDHDRRLGLGRTGRDNVHQRHTIEAQAAQVEEIFRGLD